MSARRAAGRGWAVAAAGAGALLLAGCSDDDEGRLPGERVSIRGAAPAGEAIAPAELRPIPRAAAAGDWTQPGGGPERAGGHLDGPATLTPAWTADAGAGTDGRSLGGGPVVLGERVFVRDGESGVLAFDAASGRRLWAAELAPEGQRPASGHGGGLAATDGVLVATGGFGEMLGLSPESGEILWRVGTGAPVRAAPAAADGRAVAVNRAGVATAVDVRTGARLWTSESVMTRPGALVGGGPALARGVVIVPFPSGELQLLRAEAGLRVWSQPIVSPASAMGLGAFPDLTAAPAIGRAPDGAPVIVAGNAGGALAAFEGASGRRLWQRAFGALSSVWPAGDTVFVATSEPRLVRLDLMTGRTLWATPLDGFEDPEDREGPIGWFGPVLAGGRLLTASTDGRLTAHDPETGALISTTPLAEGSPVAPVVAGGRVYVQTEGGRLLAFR